MSSVGGSFVARRRETRVLAGIVSALIAAGCTDPAEPVRTPTATPSPTVQPSPSVETTPGRPVAFAASDGVRIAGRLFGEGRVGRGAGCSGEGGTGDAWRDLVAGATWLRHRGARRIVLVGASMGGTAAVVAASQAGSSVDGAVTLSAPVECCGMTADRSVVQRTESPMLFLAGRFDADAPVSARQLARWAGSSGEVVIVASGEHGVDLVGGLATPQVQRRTTEGILAFLGRVANA